MTSIPKLDLPKSPRNDETSDKAHSPHAATSPRVKSPRKHSHGAEAAKSPRHSHDGPKSPRKHSHEDGPKSPRKHDDEHHHHRHHHDSGEDANAHMNKVPFDELVKKLDDPERSKTLPLDTLVPKLNVKGKKVCDLGAGTGTLAFAMARAGATSVVCADMDLRFLEFAAKRATEMQDHAALEKQLLFRKVPHDSPELAPREVDLFVTKDTYHHLHKRSEYLMLVKKGLAVDGRVVIVDFKKKESPNGPPLEMRVSEMVVAQELELAGFKKVNIDSTTFAHHYVIEAINEE